MSSEQIRVLASPKRSPMEITEQMIDIKAKELRSRLEHMLDVVEAHGKTLGEVVAAAPRPLCTNTGIDFLSYNGYPISVSTSKKHFRVQLAICGSCGIRRNCLNLAVESGSQFGIWGGLMPKERRGL